MPVSVSVVVATRNRTELLARALRSIARQTCADFEVIVVDDGSSVEVLSHHEQLLAELGDRFRLERSVVPGARGTGPSATRNRGTSTARGEFVAFIDDDDEWVFDKYLELAVVSLRTHNADYCFGHLEGVRDGLIQNPGWVPPPELLRKEQLAHSHPDVYRLSRSTILTIAQRFMIHPSNSVIRRDVFLRAGGFFEHLWSHAEDLSLMLRVMDVARGVLYMPQTVVWYRLPAGDSISLAELEAMHLLQRVLAAQHARLHCQDPGIRRSARAREAWTYREMALHAVRAGQRLDARVFARQCFMTYPTFGALAFAVKAQFSGGAPGVSTVAPDVSLSTTKLPLQKQ
jgi:glycosyltransferase involved in cell wall biosynthesis